jgi:cysteine-rich repeat protein
MPLKSESKGGRTVLDLRVGSVTVAVGVALWAATLVWGSCSDDSEPPPPPVCGDGVLDPAEEECDQGGANSDTEPDACRLDCRWAHCGDGVMDTEEVCDGTQLGGETCMDQGFVGGQLSCDASCMFDVSGCSSCGDGVIDGLEECDGDELGGQTCQDLDFESGVLACDDFCNLDLTGCVNGCGNGVKEGEEECDGADLGGLTCVDLGFEFGTLECQPDCTLRMTGCVGGCGNGVVEQGESCDDGNLVDYDGCTFCASGDGTFGQAQSVASCTWPVVVAAGDLDQNGTPDLVAGCAGGVSGQGGLSVHLGVGDGSFDPPSFHAMNARVTAVALPDLDGDGHLEMVVAFAPPASAPPGQYGGVAVFRGLGQATFDASSVETLSPRPVSLVVEEMDSDGLLDVVAADGLAQRVWILSGAGDTTFSAVDEVHTFAEAAPVVTADVDSDGDPVAISISSGMGSFGTWQSTSVGARPVDAAAGVFVGDAFVDLVVLNADDNTLSVLTGLGDGLFEDPPEEIPVDGGPQAVASGCLNRDTYADLVVAAAAADILWVLTGGGGGFTRTNPAIDTCDSPSHVFLADFDVNGVLDIAVACSFSQELAVHIGNAVPPQ